MVTALSLALTGAVSATTFTVDNTADSGASSLREVIGLVNANPGPHKIEFDIPGPGPYQIDLVTVYDKITETVEIDGLNKASAPDADISKVIIEGSGTNVDVANDCLELTKAVGATNISETTSIDQAMLNLGPGSGGSVVKKILIFVSV